MTVAVVAEGLVRAYGPVRALDGLDLEVDRGRVCAVLGPNGAGKTTAIRVLATLTDPDAGRAAVVGHDVVRDAALVRARSASPGSTPPWTRTSPAGRTWGSSAGCSTSAAAAPGTGPDELLDRFDLTDAADRLVKTWSGGMAGGST